MKSSIEILVHFKKFINVDLYKQGLYMLRVQVSNGQPYLQYESENDEQFAFNHVEPNRVVFDQALLDDCYYSDGFVVKYEDEVMPLFQGCLFRSQIDTFSQQSITITIELMFIDIKEIGDYSNRVDRVKLQAELFLKLKPVSRSIFVLDTPSQYNSGLFPIDFDSDWCALVETQIHTTLINCTHDKSSTFEEYLAENITNQGELDNLLEHTLTKMLDNRDHLQKCIINYITYHDKQVQTKVHHVFQQFNYKDPVIEFNDQMRTIILQALHQLHHDLYIMWMDFIQLMKSLHSTMAQQLSEEYVFQLKSMWVQCYKQQKQEVEQLHLFRQSGKNNVQLMIQGRSQLSPQGNEWSGIKQLDLMTPLTQYPFFIKHTSIIPKRSHTNQNRNVHYIVLVHGYQGQSHDMRLWKSVLSIKFKESVRLIIPTCNDCTGNMDIGIMGERLAREVITSISDDNVTDFRLSFVGHSLGGIVIRSALPHLHYFKHQMHTFITLASPHAGYASSTSPLIDTGLWMIQKWNKCKTLEQLSQHDSKDKRQTFLYQLSKQEGLNWFNYIAVTASYQDQYVPYHSARLETMEQKDQHPTTAYNEIVQNILSRCSKIDRFDLNFILKKSKIDKFIGRAAHIEFIDNLIFIKMFVYLHDEYFH